MVTSCKLLFECPDSERIYTIKPGTFNCTPVIINSGNSDYPSGHWQIELLEGWDYILSSNQSQWLKLCGETFNVLSNNNNLVALGVRHYKNKIEISPYYNRNGEQWYWEKRKDESWPIVEVKQNEKIDFGYYTDDSDNIYVIIDHNSSVYYHTFSIPHKRYWREVNFYGGGSVLPTKKLIIKKRRFCD